MKLADIEQEKVVHSDGFEMSESNLFWCSQRLQRLY